MFAYLLQGLTLGFSAGVSPGPLQAYFLSRSVQYGWRKTWPAAFAPLISDGPIVLLVLLVLTQTPAWLLRLLQLIGGVYILTLSWAVFRSLRSAPARQDKAEATSRRTLREAVVMNLLNPNPYIFWSTILGPIFIAAWRESPWLGISFVAGFYGMMISLIIGFILLWATVGQLSSGVTRTLNAISAVALLAFGSYQIWLGITAG